MARVKMISSSLLILKCVLALYLGLAMLLYLYQRKLLYFPTRYSQETAASIAQEKGLKLWMEGEDTRAYINQRLPEDPIGTILLFHGNGGSALGRTYYIEFLESFGLRVILCEYPGYGACPGRHGQTAFVAAATKMIKRAEALYSEPLWLVGESLGCGVAAAAANVDPQAIQGLLLIMPWDTLADLGQSLYPWFPTRWLTRDRFDNISNLAEFPGPVGIVMAREDEIVPNRHTQRLYDALEGKKKMWTLEGVGHNTWTEAVDRVWWQEIVTFLSAPIERQAMPQQ
jgi:pimeloyl-ACP methyl ester carboxylesterase